MTHLTSFYFKPSTLKESQSLTFIESYVHYVPILEVLKTYLSWDLPLVALLLHALLFLLFYELIDMYSNWGILGHNFGDFEQY
jgi:hypothetical protein